MSKDVNRIYWQIEKFKENKVLKNKQRKNGTHFVLRNNGSSLFNVERCVVSLHTHIECIFLPLFPEYMCR